MPSTKDLVSLLSGSTLLGGGGPTDTAFVDLRTAYGGIFYITITNGPTRLTTGVVVQAEVAPTQVAGAEVPFDCRRIGKQDAGGVSKFQIRIPPEPQFARLNLIHGDEDADVDIDFDRLSQV